ncbi:MAG: hypothetical protein ACRERU_13875, partial [Methylococcales bacterium]
RLWKFVQRPCLYATHYKSFSAFSKAIKTCLEQTGTLHRQALDSMLSLKFQTFKMLDCNCG